MPNFTGALLESDLKFFKMPYKASKFKTLDPLSPACKKTMYNSREEAEEMIRHIQEERVVRELHTYQCNTCGMWHLTSKSRK